jgi:hypothetical protein
MGIPVIRASNTLGALPFAVTRQRRPQQFIGFEGKTEEKPAAKPKTLRQKLWGWGKNVAFVTALASGLYTYGAYYLFNKDPIQAVQSVHRTTQPIPPTMAKQLKPFFDQSPIPINLEEIQVIPEFSPFFKEHNHVLPGFHGTIVLNETHYREYLEFEKLPVWRQHWMTTLFAHEISHLVQMQMIGRDAFLERIAREFVAHDNVYDSSSKTFQALLFSMKDISDPTYFVHPELTLEQSATLVEHFVGNRLQWEPLGGN